MSGSTVPGIDPALEVQEPQGTPIKVEIQPNAAANAPIFELEEPVEEPTRPAPQVTETDSIMSGYGVGQSVSLNPQNTPPDQKPLPDGILQNVQNDRAAIGDVYSTGTGSQEDQLKILGLAAGGGIAGRIGSDGYDGLTPEEKREAELNRQAADQALLAFLDHAFESFAQEFQELEANMATAEATSNDAFQEMGANLALVAQQLEEQRVELERLKLQHASGQGGVTPEQIAEAQATYDRTNALYQANAQAFAHLSQMQEENRATMAATAQRMRDLKAELKNPDTTPERRAEISALMQAEREKLTQANQRVQELQITAQTLRDVAVAARDGEGLTQAKTAELILKANGDPKVAGLIGNIADAMAASGATVKAANGGIVAAGQTGAYFTAMSQIEALGQLRAELTQGITGDPEKDKALQLKIDALDQQCKALDETANACLVDPVAQRREMERQQTWDQNPANFTITNDGVSMRFGLAITGGALALVGQDGQPYELSKMTADEQRVVLESIQAEVSNGKAAPNADVAAALVAAGVTGPALLPPDPVVLAQRELARTLEGDRVEHEQEQKAAIERMQMGGPMSAEEYNRMKAILGAEYAARLAEENKIEVQKSMELKFAENLMTFSLFGATYQAPKIEVPQYTGMPAFGILAGLTAGTGFYNSPEFHKYDAQLKPGEALPSYLMPEANGTDHAPSLLGNFLASLMGQQPGTTPAPTPTAAELRLRQELLAGAQGPTAPNV